MSLMRVLILVVCVVAINCDVYLHNPSGSNNRNCEKNANRNNGNRLFDSQNNDKGGYACPRQIGVTNNPVMYYYEGSILPIQWTAQHGCGDSAGTSNCQVILQYACEDTLPNLRDGTPTSDTDPATNAPQQGQVDIVNMNVGMHESPDYYNKCKTRYRNKNLFIADQGLLNVGQLTNLSPATQTRQNPSGGRSGLECPEERDYYPYWHPSPWKDIAVFTNNKTKCEYYQSQSQNVKETGECYALATNVYLPYNTKGDCISQNGYWNITSAFNIAPPECLDVADISSRENSLGSMVTYNWTIPNDIHDRCVLRVRYNISTDDFPSWDTDSTFNGIRSPITNRPYYYNGYLGSLALAIDTDQLGRTFQDRSYVFKIAKRPVDMPAYSKIYNLNVRGKRGNIVQVFPAVEYDFVPNYLAVQGGDYVHIQWTGSDFNPANNAGEGYPQGGDRSNFVQIDSSSVNVQSLYSTTSMFRTDNNVRNDTTVTRLAFVDQPILDNEKCATYEFLKKKHNNNQNNIDNDAQNCAKLALATAYFDAGLQRMIVSGRFNYVSTRNNNFSNRAQKGVLVVQNGFYSSSSYKIQFNITLFLLLCFFLY